MPRPSDDSSPAAGLAKAKVTRESLRQMLGLYAYLRPYRRRLFVGMVMLLGSSALGIFFPLLSVKVINSTTHEQAFHFAALMVAILFVQAVMSYFQSLLFNTVGEFGLSDLRKALFGRLIQMPMSFFSQQQVGELTSRMFADLTQLQDAFIMAVPQFLRQSDDHGRKPGDDDLHLAPADPASCSSAFRPRSSAQFSSVGWSGVAHA